MLTYAVCMLYQSHDSIYRNTQWSPQQKGVLTDLLSEHDFKYVHISAHAVCSDICSRMPTYAYVCLRMPPPVHLGCTKKRPLCC
jgi:hypothetical protein